MNRKLGTFLLALVILSMITAIILGFMISFTHPLPWILLAVLAAIPFLHKRMVKRRFVEWRDEYSVGIEAIDKDHKRLLNLINQLQTAVHYQTEDTFVDEAIDALVDYTKSHFAREEKLMQDHEYPGYTEHKKEHEAMIAKVGELLEEIQRDRDTGVEKAVQYLKNWLIKHINGTDQQYSGYLTGKGVH